MTRVGINGMGRVGRAFLRLAAQSSDLEVVAVNDLVDVRALERLIRRDSTFGRFPVDVKMSGDDVLMVGDKKVSVSDCEEPKLIPWGEHGVEIVIEATGLFRGRELAQGHIDAGASRVVISAP